MIVDALSRVFTLQSNNSKVKDSNINVIPVHHITQSALVSKARLQELRLATQSDPTLHSLTKTVHEGWPQSKKDCSEQLLDFWSFRQEISKEDGLLYKNQRLIVPHSERLETLKVLHLGHYAVDKMQLRALETVYWPGIKTKTFSNNTRVARLAPSILSLKDVNHCSLTLHQSYHGTQWQQTCSRSGTLNIYCW